VESSRVDSGPEIRGLVDERAVQRDENDKQRYMKLGVNGARGGAKRGRLAKVQQIESCDQGGCRTSKRS
jgi:hypothetical protein